MWEDFKEFALKGNVLDLAIAVIIGVVFGQIVSSIVDNIITPLIGIILNGINFSGLMWKVGNAEVTYGIFLQSILDFFIIALSIFLFLRFVLRKKREVV